MAQTSILKHFTSIGCMNVVIWLAGILLMAGLTIKDLLPLLDDYRSNNIATQVSFNHDSNFKPPQLVQVIPFYMNDDSLMTIAKHLINDTEECGICDKLESEGWAVWNETDLSKYGNDSTGSLYSALTLHFAKKLISEIEEEKASVLDDKFSHWNTPIVISAMKLFIYLGDNDIYFEMEEFDGNMKNDLVEMLDSFNNTKTLELLFTQIMQTFCQHMILQDFGENAVTWARQLDSNTSCEDLLLNQNIPAAFDAKPAIYFALPDLKVPKVKNYHFTLLESIAFSWVQRPAEFRIFGDINPLYETTLDLYALANIYKIESQEYGLNITVRYGVQVRARDARPGRAACKNETTGVCMTKCLKQMTIERCRCVPFTVKQGLTYDPDLPRCTYTLYNSCNITAMVTIRADFNDQCSAKCQDSCEYISYNWQISESSYDPPGNQSEYNLNLYPNDASFTEFTWTVKNTPEQFFSQMAGIGSFYLGFSGLSFVHFITVCFNFLRQRFFKDKRVGEKSNENFRIKPVEDQRETIQEENIGQFSLIELIRKEHRDQFDAITAQLSEIQSEIRTLKMNVKQQRV